MTFSPRMTAEIHAIHVVRPLCWRRWPGVVADLWQVECEAGSRGYYRSPDPRVIVFLDGPCPGMELRLQEQAAPLDGIGAFYMPAGCPMWSRMRRAQPFRHLDIHLRDDMLRARMAGMQAESALEAPVMLRDAAALLPLARRIAAEVERPSRPDPALDGLLTALLADLFDLGRPAPGGLPAWMMRELAAFVAANIGRRIAVPELAAIARMSESWFSRRFRETQGMTVQAWLLRQRVEAAMARLEAGQAALAQIAAETGFSDQAHMTRAFRSLHGRTPGEIRRGHFHGIGSTGDGRVQAAPPIPS
ncbi:helix-turn-helix domain-containing protein [Mangrovicoccus algicola]|uniref:Helix-turn-helix transcriptional regulator n=1 Tax=Mangrovicoccus algicola TaxID=2771008 RepID=A0A8J6ZCP1_9RHOB|nr:AraC family transcriptional regulator [Mangrovicoccus algicola]MBE3639875.1 helix-turn-helix transcriptional regulator [Mangrovicoccus algicola]